MKEMKMRKLRNLTGLFIVALAIGLALMVKPAMATFANPTAVTAGQYTAVAATSTAASVGTSIATPLFFPRRLEIQNNCASAVTIGLNGQTAVAGQVGYVLAASSTKIWNDGDGPVPRGPYSLITASATCSPDTSTGLTILEMKGGHGN
jgi:hypothetical protein